MTGSEAVAFVEANGIVLESARGPAPSLALVRLQDRYEPSRISAIREVHTPQGKHEIESTPFPGWVPPDIIRQAAKMPAGKAAEMLGLEL